MKQSILLKQALERWKTLPHSEQMALLAELATHAPGGAVIELDEIHTCWNEQGQNCGQHSEGRVVKVGFGEGRYFELTEKRYLFKSDIPKEEA